jgi:ATP-binding cassette subfamily B protein
MTWAFTAGILKAFFDLVQIGALYMTVFALVNGASKEMLIWVTLTMLVYLFGKFFFSAQADYWRGMSGLLMCTDKRMELGNRLRYVPMGYFSENNVGRVTSAVTTDMFIVEMMGPFGIDKVINGLFHALLLSVGTMIMDWRLGLITVVVIVLYEISFVFMQKIAKARFPETVEVSSRLSSVFLEYIRGIGVVRAFNVESAAHQKLEQVIKESHKKHIKLELGFVPSAMTMKTVLRAGSAVLMIMSALFYLQGTLGLAECITLIAVSFIIFGTLEESAVTSPVIRAVDASLNRLDEVFSMPEMDIRGEKITLDKKDIAIEGIDFTYDKMKVIKNVTLTIPARSSVAFIGPSGGGKTTLCRLMARFWDVDRGEIRIGNHNIKDFELDNLMENITMVFQNVYLFNDTVVNNIRFGKPGASDDEVIRIAKKARCHDFIMALENGYQTVIGEGGCTLSGGEKQRISVARAMMKDAPIILFDEATASVDPENEHEILAAIDELSKGKTVITIAHKLATIKTADQIFVIEKGEVVQHGRHETLIKQKGLYGKYLAILEKAEGWKL